MTRDEKLVERLRALQYLAEYANGGWDLPPAGTHAVANLARKAADRIEKKGKLK